MLSLYNLCLFRYTLSLQPFSVTQYVYNNDSNRVGLSNGDEHFAHANGPTAVLGYMYRSYLYGKNCFIAGTIITR